MRNPTEMNLWSRMFSSGSKEGRAEALRRGIIAQEVRREVPIFRHLSDEFSHLEDRACISYSIRRSSRSPRRWSFLQRDAASGAQYANGWLYQSAEGLPPAALHASLREIATQWTEEYLEFEATPDTLSAFCEEWGGRENAARIGAWLDKLDAACAAA